MRDPKPVGEYIRTNIMGCNFVGLTEEDEVLISFDHEDEDLKLAACLKIKEEFGYVSKVTAMELVDIKKARQIVDMLNQFLEETEKPKKDLLNIGKF